MTPPVRHFIPIELYLRYPGKYKPDAEYVDGRIEKRPPGDWTHSSWNAALLHWFSTHAKQWNIRVLPSLRIRVSPSRVRVPDISIFDRGQPIEQVPSYPPLAVFEVLSPEDDTDRMLTKFVDFEAMGIRDIWIVEPKTASWSCYSDGNLCAGEAFDLSAHSIHFPLGEIAACID